MDELSEADKLIVERAFKIQRLLNQHQIIPGLSGLDLTGPSVETFKKRAADTPTKPLTAEQLEARQLKDLVGGFTGGLLGGGLGQGVGTLLDGVNQRLTGADPGVSSMSLMPGPQCAETSIRILKLDQGQQLQRLMR
jgi:hypothetical protein